MVKAKSLKAIKLSEDQIKYLNDLYENVNKYGSLGSARDFYKLVRTEGKLKLSFNEISKFLQQNET